MQISINGNTYRYKTGVRNNDAVRSSFISLSKQTFGIDFEQWYQKGYWQDNYIPQIIRTKNGELYD